LVSPCFYQIHLILSSRQAHEFHQRLPAEIRGTPPISSLSPSGAGVLVAGVFGIIPMANWAAMYGSSNAAALARILQASTHIDDGRTALANSTASYGVSFAILTLGWIFAIAASFCCFFSGDVVTKETITQQLARQQKERETAERKQMEGGNAAATPLASPPDMPSTATSTAGEIKTGAVGTPAARGGELKSGTPTAAAAASAR